MDMVAISYLVLYKALRFVVSLRERHLQTVILQEPQVASSIYTNLYKKYK